MNTPPDRIHAMNLEPFLNPNLTRDPNLTSSNGLSLGLRLRVLTWFEGVTCGGLIQEILFCNIKETLTCIIAIALLPLALSAEDFKSARSVHLSYTAPPGDWFYAETVIEQSVTGSYFMVLGWNTGYFGIQELGNHDKVVIFSVWDPTKGDDPSAIKTEDRVEVLHQGEGVRIKRFGGEGTGGQCMAPFAWKLGETNRFALHAFVEGQKTAYTAWVFKLDSNKWWQLATFRTRTGGKPLSGYYSFIEDFRRDGRSVAEVRRARFGNGWVKSTQGDWLPLDHARFTASNATWESKDNISAGTSDGWFFLATGGDSHGDVALKSTMTLPTKPALRPQLPELSPKGSKP
ncbi:MAG: DUF3472 domain-containing protein [Pedosphaera sp.]|nr:DUF3472 domain-containing protein [Pedosphaera sp.]